ncbi:response regulator transcription factor [Nitrospirillum sp. BR 11752]|uniref:response regulator transcription factor n=1 Tax=Nitrospirillum sp. BR 11752 TaxID=3104293 RepID=UPI002EAAB0AC|nr:response regulator transcription factor [Nitrospirillum sp. BR 11752]
MSLNPSILAIDDEPQIQRLLRLGLSGHNFKVTEARLGRAALDRLGKGGFDAVILDLGLPDMSGFDVLAEIRRSSPVPVLVLSVRDHEADKIKALDLGADDYVTKPFSVGELAARLRVALKHSYQMKGTEARLRVGPLEIDLVAQRVYRDGAEVRLSPTEFRILRVLTEHRGKILTHDFILRKIRDEAEAPVDPQYLRVYVRQLRLKLGDEPGRGRLIRTEMGIGYRLTADT